MKAVHFGAGNIGRGFVGLILHRAGYELVFADVNAELIDALAAAGHYTVHEVGAQPRDERVDGFRALNSGDDEDGVRAEIASADIVTTAVGPTLLRFIAPHIVAGLRQRLANAAPLQVMACENAINATDSLRDQMRAIVDANEWKELEKRAVFANTAVDRIVPGQAAKAGLDVTVEDFFEWVIDAEPFGEAVPAIPDATFVLSLAPYIERKLFTVNTGHATAAYLGFAAGASTLSDALADPAVAAGVSAALAETSALLVAKHGLDPVVQDTYRQKILARFANPALPDTVGRIGRQPLRKLSREERLIGPAAQLAERSLPSVALGAAIAAALRFDLPDDEQSVELQQKLRSLGAEDFTRSVTGLALEHPLFPAIVSLVAQRQAELA
ncbi:mannitol-1-phosphate 5-dehydrogenase [Luethyella okanaganae]|uniref:Mannitol-1-phosphate 5-dehydrogenase n=1 Tax=Luethyella okanaganae TaxID=69372 RepID=A0ABW1VE92_9MICO